MDRKTIFFVFVIAVLLSAGSAFAEGNGAEVGANSVTDNVNAGSGSQANAAAWYDIESANVSGNQLTSGALNSNGGNRDSDDVVIFTGDYAEVANYALEASVTDNRLAVDGNGSHADSSTSFEGASGFDSNFGVTAVSLNAGSSASQSVNVNVTSAVSL